MILFSRNVPVRVEINIPGECLRNTSIYPCHYDDQSPTFTGDGAIFFRELAVVNVDSSVGAMEQKSRFTFDEDLSVGELGSQHSSASSGNERTPVIDEQLKLDCPSFEEEVAESKETKKPRRKRISARTIDAEGSLSAESNCSYVAGQPYMLRRRAISPKIEDDSETRVSAGCSGEPSETCVGTKKRVVEKLSRRRKADSVECTDLHRVGRRPFDSSLIGVVKIEPDCFAHSRKTTAASEQRVSRKRTQKLSRRRKENEAPNIGITDSEPNLYLMETESDENSTTSACAPRVGSRASCRVVRRRWTDGDWTDFFDIFRAISAEAHTVQNLKTKKSQARRRWLLCMRAILSRPPL